MIANSKLVKQRNLMEANRNYASELQSLVNAIISAKPDLQSDYLLKHDSNKAYNILFCSDLGLCGAYNSNTIKFAKQNLNKEDPLVVFGTHAYRHLKNEGFNVVNEMIEIDNLSQSEISKEMSKALKAYQKDEVSKIQVVYTRFINTVSFETTLNVLLPYQAQEGDASKVRDVLFDPDEKSVLNNLIEQMVHNVTYSLSLESKTSEQAGRRLAMETASDNADDLEEKLVLQFNQARQAEITQEINEIVSGADAL